MVGLDAGGVEHEALIRESGIDDTPKVAHGLDGVVLTVRATKDVVHLAEIDP